MRLRCGSSPSVASHLTHHIAALCLGHALPPLPHGRGRWAPPPPGARSCRRCPAPGRLALALGSAAGSPLTMWLAEPRTLLVDLDHVLDTKKRQRRMYIYESPEWELHAACLPCVRIGAAEATSALLRTSEGHGRRSPWRGRPRHCLGGLPLCTCVFPSFK